MLLLIFINPYLLVFLASKSVAVTDYCSYDVQETLQFGVSESSTASCCSNTSHTFSDYIQTIGLFQQLNASQTTTLYDSTCGLSLFEAPLGRTFQEWEDECEIYGDLRFKEDEVVWDNVELLNSGVLVSICGTRLGESVSLGTSPYSVDIACISGMPIDGITTSTVLNGSAHGSLVDPGSATWLIGIIILGSFGLAIVLLSAASCVKCWQKKRAQKWKNGRAPLKLLFLEDEKFNMESLAPEYSISIPQPAVHYHEGPDSEFFSSADQYRESPQNGISVVDNFEEEVDHFVKMDDECGEVGASFA